MNITKHLPTAGRVFTPLSMVVFLTYEIVQSQPVTGTWAIAVTIAAAFTSIGVEVVGIMSGRALEGFWRIGDAWRSLLCFGLLLLYTVMAVYILRRNDTLMPIPIIAAVVYIVSALADSLERQDEAAHRDEAFERRQRERDRELERQLKRQRQADNTAVRLAKAQKRADRNGTELDTSKTDWRTLTDAERLRISDFTPAQITEQYDVSRKTAKRWHNRAAKMSENGQP